MLLVLALNAHLATDINPPPTPASGLDLASLLTVYGPLGVFVIFLGWFARLAYRREADRSDRLEAEIARITQERSEQFVRRELYEREAIARERIETTVREQILPALEAANHATRESIQTLEVVRREQDVLSRLRAHERHERPGGDQ